MTKFEYRDSQPISRVDASANSSPSMIPTFSVVRWVLAGLLLLGLFWYRTNSWPVAAVVNYKPIWRWDLNQQMYDQIGEQVLDNLVTESLIRDEISSKGISVDDATVEARLNDIKTQIGGDEQFEQALAMQGLSVDQLKLQIQMQMGLEKLVEPSTDSAKVQEEVFDLVQKLRSEAKVWTLKAK